MSSRSGMRRRFAQVLGWVDEIRASPLLKNFVLIMALFGLLLVASGLVFVWFSTTQVVAFATYPRIQLILGGLNVQTYSEVIVVTTYYALAAFGLVAYVAALRGRRDPRAMKYLLLASFLLVLMAFLGIELAIRSKIG